MSQSGTTMSSAIIFTGCMEALAQSYQDALELGPFYTSPNHMGQQVGAIVLGFDQIDAPRKAPGTKELGANLWFEVDDIQATFDRLVQLGAEVRYPPTEEPHVGFLAYVYDLDGNILGLAQNQPE